AVAPLLNTVTLPLLLLSGVLLPLSLAPGWLRAIAAVNPLSYTVDAARALFNEHLGDPSIPLALLILAVLAVVALVGASRSFSRSPPGNHSPAAQNTSPPPLVACYLSLACALPPPPPPHSHPLYALP